MSPQNKKYSKSHEWVELRADGVTADIGITDHAQDTLGDITFIELPKVGAAVSAGGEVGVIESVKAASDLLTPVSGEVADINKALESAPEKINSDPYGEGRIFTLLLSDPSEIDALMDAAEYEKFLESEA